MTKKIGLDIGSTTIKCVVLDESNKIIYSSYNRHLSHILEKSEELLDYLNKNICNGEKVALSISGSAGMGLADSTKVNFIQEVYATSLACKTLSPDSDVVIELGGEDAKILFLTGGVEVRMNGSCAGGTGAFIDQMATLLKMDADQMNKEALKAERLYTIASRCGVFAKSDVQPLINQGAKHSDIAASIYQAVVNQTIAGLAQGRPIKGNILYLGGPLTFSSCLRNLFDKTLECKGVCPENSLLYVALGAAYHSKDTYDLNEVITRLHKYSSVATYRSLEPLFKDENEYLEFEQRHQKANVKQLPFKNYKGNVHIGIDSGSTTIKMVVIDDDKNLLYTWYRPNDGSPVNLIKEQLIELYKKHPDIHICSLTSTGYGEDLIKNAFHGDFGVVETVAHFTAAKHFLPDVDFIIDIGGQDMKCFKIENGAISNIFLNEACSSGCGSFLQTFASALGSDVKSFAKLGLYAKHPVDLGSRCTVFMNSSVKQAQKDGASIEDISAGLAISVVKNALYKVIRCSSAKELGSKIVVQGGTFYNELVLRAFEKEMGSEVIRPNIAGLMGAYGAALYGKKRSKGKSSIISLDELINFEHEVNSFKCQGCGNHCQLTVNIFADKKRYISGNRCDKPITGKDSSSDLNLYAYKLDLLKEYMNEKGEGKYTIGIPLVLNMYELLPFWHKLFRTLNFKVITSPFSTRAIYQQGQATIPSDTACYPAKLSHGAIIELLKQDIDYIYYPCLSYNMDESLGDNHYNCPVVAYYPEVLEDNIEELNSKFIRDFVDISNRNEFMKRYPAILKKHFPDLKDDDIKKAIELAYKEYDSHMELLANKGDEVLIEAKKKGKHVICLAGRPYHVDPEVNHGIDKLICKLGCAVLSEDSLRHHYQKIKTQVLNQWSYHSRLYAAANYACGDEDVDLVQLVSFGCGLDAITSDETREILNGHNKLYTQLKIDEISNLGTINIRLRSLLAAIEERKEDK